MPILPSHCFDDDSPVDLTSPFNALYDLVNNKAFYTRWKYDVVPSSEDLYLLVLCKVG